MKKKTVVLLSFFLFLMVIFSSCKSKPMEYIPQNLDSQEVPEESTVDTSSTKEMYTVAFYDYDERTILLEYKVEEGECATPPQNPQKGGCEFLGWEGDYSNITKDTTLRAVYSDEKNVFLLSTVDIAQNQIKLNLQLCGAVKTCGFDLTISYDDTILELLSVDDQLDLDIIYNQQGKRIYVNHSSANDQVKKKEIIDLTFKIKNTDVDYTKVDVEMTSIKEINGQFIDDCDYTIINDVIKIKNQGEVK